MNAARSRLAQRMEARAALPRRADVQNFPMAGMPLSVVMGLRSPAPTCVTQDRILLPWQYRSDAAALSKPATEARPCICISLVEHVQRACPNSRDLVPEAVDRDSNGGGHQVTLSRPSMPPLRHGAARAEVLVRPLCLKTCVSRRGLAPE